MKKIIFFLLILAVTNCSTKKLEVTHGLVNLDKKKDEITIGKSNKNDILDIFGPPSTVSTFNGNIWIYIELKR
jgi:Small protein A (tmRNA-binding)